METPPSYEDSSDATDLDTLTPLVRISPPGSDPLFGESSPVQQQTGGLYPEEDDAAVDMHMNGQMDTEPEPQQLDTVPGPRSLRICCGILLHMAVFCCIAGALIVLLHTENKFTAIWPCIIGGLCFVGILIEALMSETMKYLNNLKHQPGVKNYIEHVKASAPSIDMHVKCFHYEGRTRRVSQVEALGVTTYLPENYKVEVVTHRETERFQYNTWQDLSGRFKGIQPNKVTRAVCSASYRFKDEETRQAFHTQYENLKKRNRPRDIYMSDYITFNIPHFKPHVTGHWDEQAVSCWYTPAFYFCTTLMLMSFVYRCWFRASSAKTHLHFIKEVAV